MSGNHLNDLSKIYLDKVYKNNTETAEADKSRWEDLGGPTPDNYRSDDNSAKLKEDAKYGYDKDGYSKNPAHKGKKVTKAQCEGYEATKKKEVLDAFKRTEQQMICYRQQRI